jgi:uncharacterized membrane protein
MTTLNDDSREPVLFSAVLTPHRSLSASGFVIVMALVGGVSFTAGIAFLLMGAWPVFGFFGLDVLLIYLAFRANYRAGTAYEEVFVRPSQLHVRKVSHKGDVSEWTLNPVWVRLEREVHEEFGIERLLLVSHGRKLPIAGFLSPDEKKSFADALSAAIGTAKSGVPRPV